MSRIPSDIRQQVRDRANGRCEYCLLPDAFGTFSHQVDHIIPERHGGTDALDNLAWACFRCNNNKSIDIASIDFETSQLVFLFNPRQQQWSEHFVLNDGFINGLTPEGRITVRLFKMNDSERVNTRLDLINAGLC